MAVKNSDLMTKLLDRALGYTVEEVVEEYAGEEKGGELVKRKVTTKPVPPDITALKTYMELNRTDDEYERLSNEDLSKEKARLLMQLESNQSNDAQN